MVLAFLCSHFFIGIQIFHLLSIYLLILFSVASPIGLMMSDFILLSEEAVLVVFAIVCGSFLHISTTIFVEASPEHHLGLNKILISISGALLAIVVEYMM